MKNKTLRFVVVFVACLLYRLIPFGVRPPGNPFAGFQLLIAPLGLYATALFGFVGITIFNITFGLLGGPFDMLITFVHASLYAVLGVWTAWMYNKLAVDNKADDYGQLFGKHVIVALPALLFYDFCTGVVLPVLSGESFAIQLLAQIDFTLKNIAWSIGYVLLFAFLDKSVFTVWKIHFRYIRRQLKLMKNTVQHFPLWKLVYKK